MLKLTICSKELWNESNNEFKYTKEQTICLEHSLVSLSKWEAKYKKPFLSSEKTNEEIIDYIKMMTITQNVDPIIYDNLSLNELEEVNKYISDPMTATKFYDNSQKTNSRPPSKKSMEKITSELVYYWMKSFQIPFDPCQKWHLNRLLTLIRICNIKDAQQNGNGHKMSKSDIYAQNRALNAARRQKLGTKG